MSASPRRWRRGSAALAQLGARGAWLGLATLSLALVPFAPACAPPAATDDDDTDGPTPHPCPEAPPPSQPCLAGCGNELKVGFPCTRGGGECSTNTFPEAIFCTIDFEDDTDLAFCTRPCVVDEDCGSAALCTGDPDNAAAGRGCFPLACWTPPFGSDRVVEPYPSLPDGGA